MRRALGFCTAGLLLALAASPACAAARTMDVTLKSGDEEIKAFLAVPEGKGPFPGIVVIQEWWGLTDWIKDNARHLADEGYVALAPDLYRGKVATTRDQAMRLMNGMPRDRALRDLKAAADELARRDDVDKGRLGSIGWCMGGGLSLQLAIHDPGVRACAMCYGPVVTKADELKSLNAVILGLFGAEDRGITPEAVHQFEVALQEAGKKADAIREYQAGHGFMRPKDPSGEANPAYNEAAAKAAWGEIDRFFAKELKGK